MTHTEHVHLLFGIGLMLTGVLWLGAQARPGSVLRYAWPFLLLLVAGAIELSRAAGWLTAPGWRWTLPGLAVGAGLAIGVHGGTHQHLPRVGEQSHHWILGGAPLVGGVVYAAGTGSRRPALRLLLPVLLLLAGLEWVLFYRVR